MNAVSEIKEVTLSDLAKTALREHDGLVDDAVAALVARLLADKLLLSSIVHAAIADAVSYRVEQAMRSERASLLENVKRDIAERSKNAAAASRKNTVVDLARGFRFSILDFTLAKGLKLRDATREQVEEAANRYRLTSNDAFQKTRWLTAIAQATPVGKRVGDVITEKRAEQLFSATMEIDNAA